MVREGNKNALIHGGRHTRLYSIWVGMKTRCLNKNHVWFKHYGGKGVKICDRWRLFVNFREDMGESYIEHLKIFGEENTTLDRLNSTDDYSKENCRWATKLEQSTNAISTIFIEHGGKKMSMNAWAREIKISQGCLWIRYKKGLRPPLLFRKKPFVRYEITKLTKIHDHPKIPHHQQPGKRHGPRA